MVEKKGWETWNEKNIAGDKHFLYVLGQPCFDVWHSDFVSAN